MIRLIHHKGRHLFYAPGDEPAVAEALIAMAENPAIDFDGADATVLAAEMTQRAMAGIQEILK